jgi:ABC-type sugar transport system permease subunit
VLSVQRAGSPTYRQRLQRRSLATTLEAYLYLLPALVILGVFVIGPIGYIVYLSLHDWTGTATNMPWVGLHNFTSLLQDGDFANSLLVTAFFILGTVPLGLAIAFALAMLLFSRVPGMAVFRLSVLLPYVTPVVSTSIIWLWIFNTNYGLLNYLLSLVHLPPIDWLGDPHWALAAVIIYTLWHEVGFTVIILLAGLTTVPSELKEAARIDGAGGFAEFRHVVWPLMTPWVFFVLLISMIGAFKTFTQVYVLTGGGPANATNLTGYFVYKQAFQFFQISYASTISVVLFVIIAVLSALQYLLGRDRVFYQ